MGSTDLVRRALWLNGPDLRRTARIAAWAQWQEAPTGRSERAAARSRRWRTIFASAVSPAPRRRRHSSQTLEAPYVFGMDAGAREIAGEAEILAIGLFGFLDAALLQHERAKRVADGLDPTPGLVIGQRILQLDRLVEMGEGPVVVALAVFELAIQHLLSHIEQIDAADIVQQAAFGHFGACLHEFRPLRFRLRHFTERGVGDGLSVVQRGGGVAVEDPDLRAAARR